MDGVMTEDDQSRRRQGIIDQWDADPWAARIMFRFDLLAAAWGWSLDEQAAVARVSPATLAACREHRAKPDARITDLVKRLERLQFSLWMSRSDREYCVWWRRRWRTGSPIGELAPLDALVERSDGLQAIQGHLDGMLSGDFI
jgi:hypothetical protein